MIEIVSVKTKRLICAAAAVADLALFFIKLYVAVSSNSISIYVDSLNSLADTFVCALAVAGFCIAVMPPSEKYPFGFGRAESIVNFILSCVILFTGLAFLYTSFQRLLYPVPVFFMPKYALMLALTAAVKLIMAVIFGSCNKKSPSDIIRNLRNDSILDFFISLCIVLSFTLTQKIGYSIDSVTGIAASLVITVSGIRSLVGTVGSLMGKADVKAINQAYSVIEEYGIDTDRIKLYCHSYNDKKIFNAVIDADGLSLDGQKAVTDKLQEIFTLRLNGELYIKSGGRKDD